MAWSLLLLDAVLGALGAALFAYVGRLNLRRPTTEPTRRRALFAFATWWIGLAFLTLSTTTRSGLAALGVDHLGVHVAIEILRDAFVCVALAGLTSYLLYIYRGDDRAGRIARAYFALLFGLLMAVLAWTRPIGVDLDGGTATLVNERPLTGLPLLGLVLLILGPPPMLAAAYARLYTKATEPAAKRRIAIVGAALVLWFGLHIAANATPVVHAAWWPVAARVIALGAGLAIIYAYADLRDPHGRPD